MDFRAAQTAHGRFARTALVAATLIIAPGGVAQAASDTIDLPGDSLFPENVAAAADGTLYVSGFVGGGIVRVPPGAVTGEVFIAPGAFDTRSTFGVLPDAATDTLWVCSNDLTMFGIAGPSDVPGSYLKGFDLSTGVGKFSAKLPGDGPSLCSDIALGPDGSAYVTDLAAPNVYKLAPDATALEVWATDPAFVGGPGVPGLDGIAFGTDGDVYVNTLGKGELFRIDVTDDGAAGTITRLSSSRPLEHPDGMRRAVDGSFLLAEGAGRVSRVTIAGDTADVKTLADGLVGGATGVAEVGDTVWVSIGQLPLLLDPPRRGEKPTLPFRLQGIRLAK
ncbi:SMP-30/gluconolactonase/LRE family protein [Acuticoccus sediminis]|uniref:SMP-30/gluconolactonase/LRE family protein n=1 Tax=Acuticoccus sediminis TaxID=2184697 RepID=UPI001CFE9067|nr:hypothetical protein [Acuticoccus sediminis]